MNLSLLDQVHQAIRKRHYSHKTEEASRRLPGVLSREEVKGLLNQLDGTERLMATLLYGAGLRLMECCRLRVKDIDFARHQIMICAGKGNKDRYTMLPAAITIW